MRVCKWKGKRSRRGRGRGEGGKGGERDTERERERERRDERREKRPETREKHFLPRPVAVFVGSLSELLSVFSSNASNGETSATDTEVVIVPVGGSNCKKCHSCSPLRAALWWLHERTTSELGLGSATPHGVTVPGLRPSSLLSGVSWLSFLPFPHVMRALGVMERASESRSNEMRGGKDVAQRGSHTQPPKKDLFHPFPDPTHPTTLHAFFSNHFLRS